MVLGGSSELLSGKVLVHIYMEFSGESIHWTLTTKVENKRSGLYEDSLSFRSHPHQFIDRKKGIALCTIYINPNHLVRAMLVVSLYPCLCTVLPHQ